MPLKLAIDATPLLGQPTGIGHFVEQLLIELAKDQELDVRAYALTGRNPAALGPKLPLAVRAPRWPLPAAVATRLWSRVDHPRIAPWTGAVDVIHGTNFVAAPGAPAVVTVHDMTAVRYPELCTAATLRYPALIASALSRGALVQTPSQAVADEVVDYFSVAADRVVAIAHGLAATPARSATRSGPPYLLATGTIEPRKDYPTLLRAFDAVADEVDDVRLVIVGARGWGGEQFDATWAAMRHSHRVDVRGYVDEVTRIALLQSAALFVYPSIYEGFGLPPLQAMAAGVPVVATRTTVVDEVLGDAAQLVPVGDWSGLASALVDCLADQDKRAVMIEKGTQRAQLYRWADCAVGLKALYRRAAAT